MAKIEIDRERCKGCGLCLAYCPKGCIELDKGVNKKGIKTVLFSDKHGKCAGCSFCALICPDVCISVYR